MLTNELIKQKAIEYGASICGIGRVYDEPNKNCDPRQILPSAKCIIGFGFAVPRGIYRALATGNQSYVYTTMGVKCFDEEIAEIFLLKMGGLIEDYGYDACLQKSIPNLRAPGDKRTNPEVQDTYELISDSVAPDKPAPDVFLDYGKAAQVCGIGEMGISGKIINKQYGPFMRYCFIITDAPLECDETLSEKICDKCMLCAAACPGNAIGENGVNTWQCSVYYKGAHKTNPYVTEGFLKEFPNRGDILEGNARFDAEGARAVYREIDFLPPFGGYSPCFCGKKCDIACYEHIKGVKLI